jgi:hypothetical protein
LDRSPVPYFAGRYIHIRALKAKLLLTQNIRALAAARGVEEQAIAQWAGHKGAWLSKILNGDRGMGLDDIDKVADFFGLTTAQLLSPGIGALTERRHRVRRVRDRRSPHDRRKAP